MADAIDEEVPQSDLVHERLRESPIKRWLLLDRSRFALASLLSITVFSVCTGVGFAGDIPVTEPATVTTLVGSIVGGTLPFITIVLAINQLVLSQGMEWPDNLQNRFEGMVSFRRQVETVTDSGISPAAPADFRQVIVDAVVERAEAFRSAVDISTHRFNVKYRYNTQGSGPTNHLKRKRDAVVQHLLGLLLDLGLEEDHSEICL